MNNVLVAYFKSTTIKANEVDTTDLSACKLNGQPVTAINKFVTEGDACDHHVYLQVPTLVKGFEVAPFCPSRRSVHIYVH